MKIDSKDTRIDTLLKGNKFVIPRFQRPYSWEPEHIAEFWDDIYANLNDSYFIGSMVMYELERSSFAVVDGQQRLTTITILLCAIREAFSDLSETDLAKGLQSYIEYKDRSNKTVYVLDTETSYPYLQEEILKNSPADAPINVGKEEEAIQKAFSIFKSKIASQVESILSDKEQSDVDKQESATKWLISLRDTVFDLNVIIVTLDNEDDAYLIFETLNTRGKDLALSDLLRNHFTKYLKSKSTVDSAKLKWEKVLGTLSDSSISLDPDTFIVHSWQSRYDFIGKAKMFPKIRSRVTKTTAKFHLDQFVSDATLWRAIFDTDYLWDATEKRLSHSLNALRIFKVVQPTAGLLSLIRAYKNETIKLKTLQKSIHNIEKFHFSFNAITSSRSSGGISGMYSSFGRQIFECQNSDEAGQIISNFNTKLKDRTVAPSEFDAGFGQLFYTKQNSKQKSLVRYILKNIAVYEKQKTIGNTEDLTIEHLIPQSENSSANNYEHVGQIGNLILVDQKTNEALANKSFLKKKKILQDSGYELPELLLSQHELTPEIIQENTQRISVLSRDHVWKI